MKTQKKKKKKKKKKNCFFYLIKKKFFLQPKTKKKSSGGNRIRNFFFLTVFFLLLLIVATLCTFLQCPKLLVLLVFAHTIFSIGNNIFFDTFARWQRDERFRAFADDEDVAETGGELMAGGVDDVCDVERTRMTLDVLDQTNTPKIASTNNHAEVAEIEFNNVDDFASFNVDFNGVGDLDDWIRVANGAAVVCDDEWHAFGADQLVTHATQLELCFGWQDFENREAAFDVVQQAKVLVGFWNLNDVHEAARKRGVGAHFAVDFHQALHEDLRAFASSQSVPAG